MIFQYNDDNFETPMWRPDDIVQFMVQNFGICFVSIFFAKDRSACWVNAVGLN